MRNLLRKLLPFCAALALATGAVPCAVGQASAPEPPPAKKESKDVKLAKQLHIQFTMQMGVHDDYVLQDYVQRIGQKLASVSEKPDLDWKFTIVDTDDVNAFATLEGYVYISRGILPYFQSEAELAAVLGHEIGQITAEHLKSRQRKGALAGLASAASVSHRPAGARRTDQRGRRALISGYGRDAELEADRLGAKYPAAGCEPLR
jgi:predicted Zn-dependent protease